MFRKLVLAALIIGAVVVGMMAQAGSYLLALPSSGSDAVSTSGSGFSAPGPHPVGVRELGVRGVTAWYPAVGRTDNGAITYSYGFNMLGADTSITLATYDGIATPNAEVTDSAGPFPLVLLSHGFAITPSSYAWLAEHLASWGFVVVAPQHRESLDPGTLWRSTIERPGDVDEVRELVEQENRESGTLRAMVDTSRVAVVGHSYGGYTALAVGGATIDVHAFQSSCDDAGRVGEPLEFLCGALVSRLSDIDGSSPADSRVDAVVSIAGDAAMFGESGLAAVSVPILAIGGTADVDSPFEWSTRYAYESVSSSRKAEVAFEGAGHLVFAGGCDNVRRVLSLAPMGFCSDEWDRGTVHEVVRGRVAAFLLAELVGDRQAAGSLSRLDPQIAGVSYRSEGY